MDSQEEKIETVKAPITFTKTLVPTMDRHWRSKDFKSRTDYINYLVRKDMEECQKQSATNAAAMAGI
jgi:Arc/MetJ-type ribon-helix-helix transcriptional regulator